MKDKPVWDGKHARCVQLFFFHFRQKWIYIIVSITKFCSDENQVSGQQRNALCTCFQTYLTCFFCILTAVQAGQEVTPWSDSSRYIPSCLVPQSQTISRHSLEVALWVKKKHLTKRKRVQRHQSNTSLWGRSSELAKDNSHSNSLTDHLFYF